MANIEPSDIAKNFRADLEKAIIELERLIGSLEQRESAYQEFFEQNPIAFHLFGYRHFISFTKASGNSLPQDEFSTLKPEPDFIVQRASDGLWEIFELKTPFARSPIIDSNKYRERFTAEVISYVKQMTVYAEYFSRNPANRVKVQESFGIAIQPDIDIKIVFGLRDNLDRAKIQRELRSYTHKIDMIAYDDILEIMREYHSKHFGIQGYEQGFSFHFIVRFNAVKDLRRKYFLDIGSIPNQNRISFYLDEQNDFCFDVLNDTGRAFQVKIDNDEAGFLSHWVYLVCEFGSGSRGFYMHLALNGVEKEQRIRPEPLDVKASLHLMFLGCSFEKNDFGNFDIAEQLIYQKLLDFRDTHKLLGYVYEKHDDLDEVNTYVAFDGTKFLERDEQGNFSQENHKFQPVFRVNA